MRSRGWIFISWLVLLSLLFSACAPEVPTGTADVAQPEDAGSAAEAQPNRSIYTEEKCEFEGSEFVDQSVRCGLIQVPEDREDPDSAMLELHAVERVGGVRNQFAEENFALGIERVDQNIQQLLDFCLKGKCLSHNA